jgi:Arc/MetJ-type ribon-helix-helix transcriptional regulator
MSKAQRVTPIMQLPLPDVLKQLIDRAIEKHHGNFGSRSDFMRKAAFAFAKEQLATAPAPEFEAEVEAALAAAATK